MGGSWQTIPTGSCGDFDGWYPSFMSMSTTSSSPAAGHLDTTGWVFYLDGCQGVGDTTPGGRQYSTRTFTIHTAQTLTVQPTTGTDAQGETEALTATLLDSDAQPVANAPVTFTVSGANPANTTVLTDSFGQATYEDVGTSAGVDSITAAVTGLDADATVTWLARTSLSQGGTCDNQAIGGTVNGDLSVATGSACVLLSTAHVAHDARVDAGAVLIDQGGAVDHDLVADQPAGIVIHGSSAGPAEIGHDLSVQDVTGAPGGGQDNRICDATIGHDLSIDNGTAGAALFDVGDCSNDANTVGHDLTVQDNAGAIDVSTNEVGHDLTVQSNTPGGTEVDDNSAGAAICQNNHLFAGSGNTPAGSCDGKSA